MTKSTALTARGWSVGGCSVTLGGRPRGLTKCIAFLSRSPAATAGVVNIVRDSRNSISRFGSRALIYFRYRVAPCRDGEAHLTKLLILYTGIRRVTSMNWATRRPPPCCTDTTWRINKQRTEMRKSEKSGCQGFSRNAGEWQRQRKVLSIRVHNH